MHDMLTETVFELIYFGAETGFASGVVFLEPAMG